jgi:hypothetical protein
VFVALVIQHTKRIHHIVIVVCPAQQYFSTLSHKWHDFLKKKLLNTKYVLISLQMLSEIFLILRRTERDMIENVYWSLFKVQFFLSDFKETSIFSTDFGKVLKHQIS